MVSGSSYQITETDTYIGVLSPGLITITLPPNPQNGRQIIVKDEYGDNRFDPDLQIVIVPYNLSDLIDGLEEVRIHINYGCLKFLYRNGWHIIGELPL